MATRTTAGATDRITAAEMERRRQAVDASRHSAALEGLQVSEETRADEELYVAGDLTLDELGERIRIRHGVF